MKIAIIAALGALALASPARADAETAGALLATMSYVQQHCPRYRVNAPRVRDIMTAAGEDMMSWGTAPPPAVLGAAATLTMRFEKGGTPDEVCAKIWDQFGTGGENFPGTISRK